MQCTKRQAHEEPLTQTTKRQPWSTKRQAPIECWTEHGENVYHRLATQKKLNSTPKRTKGNSKPKRENKRAEMFSVVIITSEHFIVQTWVSVLHVISRLVY